ncbi:BRCA1-associated ATM activator 1 isoform X2 [Pleurodeles waltl]|uniref:BRCA1-associated ATM activator 1 isoform X2 n=1 Tax=Pleurodeles waltl TaxID=8319 RepID=UPI0037096813
MDRECMQLLPAVCAVLADPRQPLSDDTCLEKLLDWFRILVEQGTGDQMLVENPCLTEFIVQVQKLEDPDPNLLSFTLRLMGMFAASDKGFQHFLERGVLLNLFGATLLTSDSWEDATVRSGWIRGVHSLVQHTQALKFLCDIGAVEIIFTLQGDPSLFVASAANQLLVHVLISSIQLNIQQPTAVEYCNWPECAKVILSYLEKSLCSKSPSLVTQSLKSWTAVFRSCHEMCTELFWLLIAEPLRSLLEEKPVYAESALVDLLLSMARSPVFSNPASPLWTLLTNAMQNFSPLQTAPLALGVLKLHNCPKVIHVQSLSVLLQPLDCVLKASTVDLEFKGMLDELVCDPAAVETLMYSRSSCVALMCQALTHLQELHQMASLPEDWPHTHLLNAVVAVLQFCIGTATVSSPKGVKMSQLLIGSLRVQGLAVEALSSFSCSNTKSDWLPKIFDILLAYLRSPDTSPTILNKCFQTALKWVVSSSETENLPDEWAYCEHFLRGLSPVLQKRLCSPAWETRDSALEFLTHLIRHLKDHHGFQQIVFLEEVKELVWDLLKDPISYVRASAVSTLGQLFIINSEISRTEHDSTEKATIVSEFLEMLLTDTEAFPRRAVVKVFTDWLRQGHMRKLWDEEQMMSRLLTATNCDLDWEVKVNGLVLAEVFVEQTLGKLSLPDCPYAVVLTSKTSVLAESLEKFCRIELFPFLLRALCDCDRPVAQKSCDILLCLKVHYCKPALQSRGTVPTPIGGTDWVEDVLKKRHFKGAGEQGDRPRKISPQESDWVLETLGTIDLEALQVSLERSSDHIENSPQSLLQDILATVGTLDENGIDCY